MLSKLLFKMLRTHPTMVLSDPSAGSVMATQTTRVRGKGARPNFRNVQTAVGTKSSLTQPRFAMSPTYDHVLTCLLKAADRRPRAVWPGSGGGCRARRHVGWTRRRSRHPLRSPRTTRRGRATPRGRAASDLVSRRRHPRRSRRQAPDEISRPPGHSKTFATGHRPYIRTRFPKRQSERTKSGHTFPDGHAMGRPFCSARGSGRGGPGWPPGHVGKR